MRIIVLRGIPGSGKTTYIERLRPRPDVVVSADHFFYTGTGASRRYVFDPTKLPEAHAACLRAFLDALQARVPFIVVDNTNTTGVEAAPYMALAAAFGYEAEIHQLACDPRVAAARNVHGVPAEAVARMAERLASEQLPPWWRVVQVTADGR